MLTWRTWEGPQTTTVRAHHYRHRARDVILTEVSIQAVDSGLYHSLGLNPTDYKILLVNSCVHYRVVHDAIAKKTIELVLPGWHGTRLAAFPWKKLRRPVFPLDVEALGISELRTE